MKSFLPLIVLLSASMWFTQARAAVRDGGGSNKMVGKLQMMLNEVTAERDQLKASSDKMRTELEQLNKELEKLKTDAQKTEKQLNSELSAEKSSNSAIRQRLDQTNTTLHEAIGKIEESNAKYYEVVDKYNELTQNCNDLDVQHKQLQNQQKATADELATCERKNIKMYEGAKKIIDGYESCKKRGVVDTLIDSEPFFQIKSVETETLMQEYEDKLRKQKYQKLANPDNAKQNQAIDETVQEVAVPQEASPAKATDSKPSTPEKNAEKSTASGAK